MNVSTGLTDILYQVSPSVTNDALNELFKASWPTHIETDFRSLLTHSLLYLCAYHNELLVGFVNLAWDGGCHAFLLDTTVHPTFQRRGIGLQLVHQAITQAQAKGVHWVHVDYESHLTGFYQLCGFQSTQAGLMRLNQ